MTVDQLIERLQEAPGHAEVFLMPVIYFDTLESVEIEPAFDGARVQVVLS